MALSRYPSVRSLVTCFASLLAIGIVTPSAAQDLKEQVLKNAESLRTKLPGLTIQLDDVTGLPNSVQGLSPKALSDQPTVVPTGSLSQSALDAMRDNARRAVVDFFGSTGAGSQLFPTAITGEQFVVEGVAPDPDFPASSVVNVQQAVEGIPVFGAKSRVLVTPTADVTSITGNFASITPPTQMQPSISREVAITTAETEHKRILTNAAEQLKSQLAAEEGEAPAVKADLAIFDPAVLHLAPGKAKLTWKVDIGNFSFFVDAATSEVVYFFRDHRSALRRQVFDLADGQVFPGSLSYDEVTNQQGAAAPDAEAQAAYANSEIVYRYLESEFGRLSFDALGGPLVSHVRYGGFANAQWCPRPGNTCPAPNVMVYGTGYTRSLDIAAHEVMHGVIASEADLIYVNESGALNESFADFFGTLASRSGGDDDWLIGEDLPGHSASNPVRSLEQPTTGGFLKSANFSAANKGQPDHYSDRVTTFDRICSSTTDFFNGCVHINSGIVNRALFLASQGGSQSGVTVAGIGTGKVGRIVYRALTTKLIPTSTFLDAAKASYDACNELVFAQVATTPDCEQVRLAFAAVGLHTTEEIAAGPQATPTALGPLQFTAEQSTTGGIVYSGRCRGCHGATLLGGLGPPLAGPLFRNKWYEGSVGALYDFVKTRMPKVSPGSLTPTEYLHLVALIVKVNGATPGTESMPENIQALTEMGFKQPATDTEQTTQAK
ncbi:M4 family metallopeptidase [Ensifer sp. ENS06]|uniref:M4 family metallopeptidase n=1 Tax=Ensifer sp. ENS06 TaxID=2769276 RepID=UPI00177B40F2|nr:M4 family metallopeptidase [Ensifer sp. ENS06]MBD9624770.1 M4 family metallopeptidase [Ensifer sp. ENS06]